MKRIVGKVKAGQVALAGVSVSWRVARTPRRPERFAERTTPIRLHLGPGPNWVKPSEEWLNVDVHPRWGDIVVNFQEFDALPLKSDSVTCIYGSHVFEHMSVWVTDNIFSECARVLKPGGVLRIVLPDVVRSMEAYLANNEAFPLFERRRARAEERYGRTYTLFDCLREDFISRSGQASLLGQRSLAHQNAWDFETLKRDLLRAGFASVERSTFQGSRHPHFGFEGTFESEASEDDRSLYVDAVVPG